MAKFKFTRSTEHDCLFYDEKGEYFEPSVKAFFEPRSDEEIRKEVMGVPPNICIPILESESMLQFGCKLVDGCWELDFWNSIAS